VISAFTFLFNHITRVFNKSYKQILRKDRSVEQYNFFFSLNKKIGEQIKNEKNKK